MIIALIVVGGVAWMLFCGWMFSIPWVPKNERQECEECGGTGHEMDYIDPWGGPDECFRCRGRGWLRVSPPSANAPDQRASD